MDAREMKEAFVRKLQDEDIPAWLHDVDGRIVDYIRHVSLNSLGESDVHNVDEVAACCRFLRMCRVYEFDADHVRRFVRMAERLKIDSMEGRKCYTLSPSQVFIIAGTHGFLGDVVVDYNGTQKTETRKVVKECILFIPRKWSKTQFAAWEAVDDFVWGENDAEVHLVSNAMDQSQIVFRQIKSLLSQIDPKGRSIRMTSKEISWRNERKAYIFCHTAGAKTKDGAKASKVIGDEYGSAGYVKDHCDMSNALKVYESSMGPRRNRLTVICTTAGRVIDGPFEHKLRSAQKSLYEELNAVRCEKLEGDMQFLFSLHPDEWEYTDESFGTERLWKKVNPHLGVTVQSTFYEEEWSRTKGDPEHYKEVVTKLFNKFVSNSSRPWITSDVMRRLQGETGIRGLDAREWVAFAACDFSKGDDLCAIAWLCYNLKSRQYLFDCDAWIAEEQLTKNSNSALYSAWIEQGWLHVCPGSVIDEGMVLRSLDDAARHVRLLAIGYDPYDSTRFVNMFREWILNKVRGRMSGKPLEDFLQRTLQPVRQTWAEFNAPCQVMYDLVHWPEQRVWLSSSPLIPWCFGNCVLEEDRMGNVKPVKRTHNAKIDVAICLLMCIKMMEGWKT